MGVVVTENFATGHGVGGVVWTQWVGYEEGKEKGST